MRDFYFTTSWDDGSILDLKMAAMLDKYGIKGTFYIPKEFDYSGGKFSEYGGRLNADEIKIISKNQEVGAHSLTHRILTRLSDQELQEEVNGSKKFIEEIIGRKVLMFCPPEGLADERIINVVERARFKGLRTTDKLNFILPKNPFHIGASIQAAPFPFRKKSCQKIYWSKLFNPIEDYGLKLFSFPSLLFSVYSWEVFTRASLEYALNHGNYFHLYGHSWVLEKYCMWDKLENFFKHVSQIHQIKFITNSEILGKFSDENFIR